jgi:nucleoside-diphosphate-sugar epimerase
MRVLITGGAGFLGGRLTRTLLTRGHLLGRPLSQIVVSDLAAPATDLLGEERLRVYIGSLLSHCAELGKQTFDVVFHLAGAVSAECEADFDLGMHSNLDTTRALLDAVRASGNRPRFIFASSVAVFGSDPGLPLPAVVRDDTLATPQSSYGIQKFICEQLVADYTRKDFVEGRTARLMTVTVRPGRPNGAASAFLSSMVCEPLAGRDAVCPLPPETAVAIASPARTIEGLIVVAEASHEDLGGRTAINLPALTVRLQDILDAVEVVGGKAARERVRFKPDATIERVVGGWPSAFENTRAHRLGLQADADFLSIVHQYMNDQTASPGRQ